MCVPIGNRVLRALRTIVYSGYIVIVSVMITIYQSLGGMSYKASTLQLNQV